MAKANDSIYASAEFIGFSIWLVPEEAAGNKLEGVIQEYATQLGTPAFAPHMTLLGGIVGMPKDEVVSRTRTLAECLREYEVEIEAVTTKELLYFQCVFGLLRLTPDLQTGHQSSKQAFDRLEDPEFMPHISLVYGDLSTSTRSELKQALGAQLDGMKMKLTRLQLWNTTGPVRQWELIDDIELNPTIS